jgi:1,4-dihydroxy-2-naphthoate octaprenyltransferase
MARPSQLLLIVLVYGLGVAIALAEGASIDGTAIGGSLAALVPTAASVHYANEYADYWGDRLSTRTPFSGGSGALARTGLPRRLALAAAVGTLAFGAAITAGGLLSGTIAPVAAGVIALIAVLGRAYSLGPALSRRGLGELDNTLLGGLALPLYGYAVASGQVAFDVLLDCLPFALLVFANLLATQWPDRDVDAAVGKGTLPTRWPPRRLRGLHILCVGLSFALLVVPADGVLPALVARASFLALPLSLWGVAWFTRRRSPFPAVAAMVCLAIIQILAWGVVAFR